MVQGPRSDPGAPVPAAYVTGSAETGEERGGRGGEKEEERETGRERTRETDREGEGGGGEGEQEKAGKKKEWGEENGWERINMTHV